MSVELPIPPNPSDNAILYGHESAYRRIRERLRSLPPQSCSVVGLPGFGKSSLLTRLQQELRQAQGVLCICVELKSQRVAEPSELTALLTEGMLQAARESSIAIEHPLEIGNMRTLEHVLKALHKEGRICLFFLDDFDMITMNRRFERSYFDWLRSLTQGDFTATLVAASCLELQVLCYSDAVSVSPFFNIFTIERLGALKEGEALHMLATQIESETEQQRWLRIVGPHPYGISVLMGCLRQATVAQNGEQPSVGIRKQLQEQMHDYYNLLWNELSTPEQRALQALAENVSVGADPRDPVFLELTKKGLILGPAQSARLISEAFATFVLAQRMPDKLHRLTHLIYHRAQELLEEWLKDEKGERDFARMHGSLPQKLQEYLLENESARTKALELLGLSELRNILRTEFKDSRAPANLRACCIAILQHCGFKEVVRPDGVATSIDVLKACAAAIEQASDYPVVYGNVMIGCHECEKCMRELCEFYAFVLFGEKFHEAMTQANLVPKKNSEPLRLAEMTLGQRKETLHNLQNYSRQHPPFAHRSIFDRGFQLFPGQTQECLQHIGRLRGGRFAHETAIGNLFQGDLEELKKDAKTLLEHIRTLFQTWQIERIYPRTLVYESEYLDRHGLRLCHTITDSGDTLKIYTPLQLQPGVVYYCYSVTNPVALEPILVPKQTA